jgi:hypothetical protein
MGLPKTSLDILQNIVHKFYSSSIRVLKIYSKNVVPKKRPDSAKIYRGKRGYLNIQFTCGGLLGYTHSGTAIIH